MILSSVYSRFVYLYMCFDIYDIPLPIIFLHEILSVVIICRMKSTLCVVKIKVVFFSTIN